MANTKVLQTLEEALARLIQEAHWEDKVQQNAPNMLPSLDAEILEQCVQKLVEDTGRRSRAGGDADDHDCPDRCLRCFGFREGTLIHHSDFGPGGCQAGIVLGISSKLLAIGSLALEDRQAGACYA